MEALNRKLDRAVEAAKIKPDARLKTMQNNEKLVAVNERIDEAMNYRKELKEFEIKEGERVAALKLKNEENQRKTLIKNQVSCALTLVKINVISCYLITYHSVLFFVRKKKWFSWRQKSKLLVTT